MSAAAKVKTPSLDPVDRQIVLATQDGLPLSPRPYHTIAAKLGLLPDEVMDRMRRMLETGVIRRIGAIPNHYALGYKANGMTVWNVPDAHVTELGRAVGALDFVSHCYERPRYLPEWPYNLFAMVHARSRPEVAEMMLQIGEVLGSHDHGHDVLFSIRILKKKGLRLRD
ncbi:MAG: AsnC family transcriptional regulator [Mariprofundaceae bacterium]